MDYNWCLRVQIHNTIRKLQAHVDAMQQGQSQLPHMEQVVQRATWHVLCDKAEVGHLQTSANKSHQSLVPEMTEGFNLSRQVLNNNLRCRVIVQIQLLYG